MINGVEYAYEDVQIVIQGKSIPLLGVRSIEYGATKTHDNLYGRGNRPVAMGRGKKEWKPGKLVVYQSEFEEMQAAMPAGKDILDRAPFMIVCAYAPEAAPSRTDKLYGCRITEWTKGIGDEDTHMEIELAFLPFDIQLNA